MENIAHDSPAGAGKTVPAAVVVVVVAVVVVVVGGVVVPDQGEKFAVIYFAVAVAVKPLLCATTESLSTMNGLRHGA